MRLHLLTCTIFAISFAANAALSDDEARRQAIEMDRLVSQAKNDLNQLVPAGNRDGYAPIRARVSTALEKWPAQHLDNRSAFPYFSCPEAARGLLQYGDAWSRKTPGNWAERAARDFNKASRDCKEAIRSPDMSLKDIR